MKKDKDEVIKRLREELHENDAYIDELQLKVKSLDPDNYKKQIQDLEKRNNLLEETLEETEKKFFEEIAELNETIATLESKDEKQSLYITKIKKDLESLQKTIESKNDDIFVLQTDVFNEQRLRKDVESRVANLEEEICKLNEKQVKQQKGILDEIKICKQQEEIDSLIDKNIYLSHELDKITRRNVELITMLNTIKNSTTKRQKFCNLI